MKRATFPWCVRALGVGLAVGAMPWGSSAQERRSFTPASATVTRPTVPVQRDRATDEEARRAATRRAVENLYAEIKNLPLSSRWTVGQYIDHMEAREEMIRSLEAAAETIGGPRWIDDSTVQINLEIQASRVTQALQRIAASRPKASPIGASQIAYMVDTWPRRSFAANGASASATQVQHLKPRMNPQWQGVSDEAREKALAAATQDAVNRAMDRVKPVRLARNQTIADAFAIPEVAQKVRDWLSTRPVTQVDFREDGDLFVELALAVNEVDYLDTVRAALAGQDRVAFPKDEEELKRIEREFFANFRPVVGRGVVQKGAPRNAARAGFPMPDREPAWIDQIVRIEGTAPLTGRFVSATDKLRVMGRAEQDAVQQLRARIDALPLDGATVGEAAKQDPRIEAAVRRAMAQAEFAKSTWRPGDTAVANLSLDLRALWEELLR